MNTLKNHIESAWAKCPQKVKRGLGFAALGAPLFLYGCTGGDEPEQEGPTPVLTTEVSTPTEEPYRCAIFGLEDLYENDTACMIEPQATPPSS